MRGKRGFHDRARRLVAGVLIMLMAAAVITGALAGAVR